ncbi:MAG TPA: hypothetical protein ENH39_07395 [Gammaproteobacteria bacterium]|nr:hypothetical protein [Gammaproteobacteria bacterium]
MGPFMQELVSFISIMLGVVVLTAWVMWILLRPSGDNKAQDFASKSARDGQTLAVMENNELKNKVTRLERELKVLMSAGYGKNVGERGKGKGEGSKIKDEGLKIKDMRPKVRKEGRKVEGGRGKGKNKRSRSVVPGAMSLDGRSKIKDKKFKVKGVKLKAKDEGSKIKDEGLKIKDVRPKVRKKGRKAKVVVTADKKPVVEEIAAELAAPKQVETTRSSKVVPLSETQRITEEADKKKIADFLTSVAETTERQRKKVEALDEENEALEEVSRYPDDDLKKIKGIGPHLERKLKKAGIRSYRQISDFNEDEVRHISKVIGSYPRRIRRETWVEQAKVLVGRAIKD